MKPTEAVYDTSKLVRVLDEATGQLHVTSQKLSALGTLITQDSENAAVDLSELYGLGLILLDFSHDLGKLGLELDLKNFIEAHA